MSKWYSCDTCKEIFPSAQYDNRPNGFIEVGSKDNRAQHACASCYPKAKHAEDLKRAREALREAEAELSLLESQGPK